MSGPPQSPVTATKKALDWKEFSRIIAFTGMEIFLIMMGQFLKTTNNIEAIGTKEFYDVGIYMVFTAFGTLVAIMALDPHADHLKKSKVGTRIAILMVAFLLILCFTIGTPQLVIANMLSSPMWELIWGVIAPDLIGCFVLYMAIAAVRG